MCPFPLILPPFPHLGSHRHVVRGEGVVGQQAGQRVRQPTTRRPPPPPTPCQTAESYAVSQLGQKKIMTLEWSNILMTKNKSVLISKRPWKAGASGQYILQKQERRAQKVGLQS